MKHARGFSDRSSFAERQRAEVARLRLPAGRVRRDALLRRLDRLEPLTFLHSLPGTGKTTLLADWAIHRMDAGDAVIWISATAAHNSLGEFGAAIADIVLGRSAADAESAEPKAEEAAERRECLGRLCAEQPNRKVIVLIDNAEHITSAELRSWILALLREHPNLYFAGAFDRVQPSGELAREAGMSIHMISGQHLMIPRTHAASFASSWGHDTTPEEIDRLHSMAGGWLLLMRTILDTPSDFIGTNVVSGMERFRDDHLREKLNGRLVASAVPMSLLEEVSVELVDVLYREVHELAREAAGATAHESVRMLVDSGMLRPSGSGSADSGPLGSGPADAGPPISGPAEDGLCFPGVVRAYLAYLVETLDPRTAKATHAAAADHYERRGRPEDVRRLLRHARRAEDWELLNRTVARHGWWLAVRHQADAYSALSDIPEAARRRHPVLSMAYALSHALPVATIDPSPRSPMVHRVLASVSDLTLDLINGTGDPDEMAFLTSAAMHGLRQRGEFVAALQRSEHFRNAVLRGSSNGLSALNSAMYYLQSGLSELSTGDLERAVRRFTRSYEESTSTQAQFVGVSAAGHNALIFAYEGRRAVAEQWFERAEQGLERVPWVRPLVQTPLVLAAADLAMDSFDAEQARRNLEEAGSLLDYSEVWAFNAHAQTRFALLFGSTASTLSSIEHAEELRSERSPLGPLGDALLTRARVDLLIAEGELNRAERLILEALGDDPLRGLETECTIARRTLFIAYARLCLISGSFADARQAVSIALARKLTQRKVIDLLLIDAAAAHAMGSDSDAVKSFRRALALTKRAGILSPLLSIDRVTRQALLDLVDEAVTEEGETAQQIIDSPGVFPAHGELVVLTERERSVLNELVGGASIPDIARTHVLSVNTVKKQTVSLYRKLGADNRTDAVRRAYELRLIG
ncbi:helix-turn-helix transcriptional regulator [Brevibacterium daeguense]|nr:LuxR C-terminal-related transcriptional regulator [Brevibacterium daeguense]